MVNNSSKINRVKVEALIEIKKEYLQRRLQYKLSEDALLSEIADQKRQSYEKLYQLTRVKDLQLKIATCLPLIIYFYNKSEIMDILIDIEQKTKVKDFDKLFSVCQSNGLGKSMKYETFVEAHKELSKKWK